MVYCGYMNKVHSDLIRQNGAYRSLPLEKEGQEGFENTIYDLVMGDPRYGKGNRDGKPMRLIACALEFQCPLTGKQVDCRIGGSN
jgi:hypothetical protein